MAPDRAQSLKYLLISTDIGTSRTVLRGILAAQLGPNRTIQRFGPSKVTQAK